MNFSISSLVFHKTLPIPFNLNNNEHYKLNLSYLLETSSKSIDSSNNMDSPSPQSISEKIPTSSQSQSNETQSKDQMVQESKKKKFEILEEDSDGNNDNENNGDEEETLKKMKLDKELFINDNSDIQPPKNTIGNILSKPYLCKMKNCSVSEKGFNSITELDTHIFNAHLIGSQAKCCTWSNCERDKSFSSISDLNSHIRYKHTNYKPFQCEFCSSSFVNVSELNRHRKRIHKVVEKFKKPNHLHIDSNGPLVCKWMNCQNDQTFNSNDLLVEHIIHCHIKIQNTNEPRCLWSDCPRNETFQKKYHLVRHFKLVHTGERPYKCPFENCTFKAINNSKITHHILKTHSQKNGINNHNNETDTDSSNQFTNNKSVFKF